MEINGGYMTSSLKDKVKATSVSVIIILILSVGYYFISSDVRPTDLRSLSKHSNALSYHQGYLEAWKDILSDSLSNPQSKSAAEIIKMAEKSTERYEENHK